MPTNKPKVISYLHEYEKAAFDKFCDDNDYSNSQGVAHLIREQLIDGKKTVGIDVEKVRLIVKSVMPLDEIEKSSTQAHRLCQKTEKLEEKIAILQSSIDKLATRVETGRVRELTDEDIAAIVRQPVEKVYLWRTGHQKPRGKRILEKLRPFEVVHGQWRLRNKIA